MEGLDLEGKTVEESPGLLERHSDQGLIQFNHKSMFYFCFFVLPKYKKVTNLFIFYTDWTEISPKRVQKSYTISLWSKMKHLMYSVYMKIPVKNWEVVCLQSI